MALEAVDELAMNYVVVFTDKQAALQAVENPGNFYGQYILIQILEQITMPVDLRYSTR